MLFDCHIKICLQNKLKLAILILKNAVFAFLRRFRAHIAYLTFDSCRPCPEGSVEGLHVEKFRPQVFEMCPNHKKPYFFLEERKKERKLLKSMCGLEHF